MDGSAYHAARCRRSGIGIVRADVILMGINLRGHTYAWRRDVRYGTNPEAIRFQACDDAPEGYPRRRACAVRRHALRGVVSVPVAQSTLRTRPRRDTRGMLSGRNGKQRDMLSCQGRHSPERSHDGSLHAPCPYRNPRPCAPPCRKGSQRRCHGNVPEHRASSNRAYHSRLRGKPLLRKVHGEDNAHAVAIAFIIGIIVSHNAQSIMSCSLVVAVVVILHNVLGLALGYGVGKVLGIDFPKRTAIAIEVGMQNSGLATSLAATHFAMFPMATVPGAIFSVWHNFSGSIAAQIFRKLNKRD